jgi:hypothetical protein
MARIPLYNQGRGSTQQLATGSLSPTANVGAFAAPGQALASFANSAGQIAFDFGMAERRKQDEDAIQNTNAKFIEDSTQYIRDNPTDNTQTFKNNYKVWKDNWVDKNTGNLGSRRKRLVLNKVNRSFALENLKGQQKAYNLGEFNAINATNAQLDKNRDIMENYPKTSAEYIAAESDKNLIFDNNKKYGRNYKYTQYSFDLAVTKGNFLKQAPSINSEAAYKNFIKDVDNNKTLDFSQKSALKTIGETQFKTNKSNQIDGILKTLVSANSTGPTILDAQSAVISGKNSFTYQEGGETKTISFANLDLDGKQLLQQELGLLANQTQNVVLRSGNASLTTFLQTNPSLASMKNKQKDLENGTGEYKLVSFEVRNKLLGRLGKKITEKVAKSKIILEDNLTKINNSVSVDGDISENTQKLMNESKILANSIDETGIAAKEITNTFKSTSDAISLFNETNFDTSQEISATLNELNQEERLEQDTEKKFILSKKKELFTKMHANRQKAIKNKPYEYFETALIKNNPDGPKPTPRQILNAQIEAGVPLADRRLISTATENNFVKSYKETTDLNEKENLYNEFFSQFNIDDQNLIVRNMIRRGSITLRDNIFLSDPDNLVAGDLFTSNADTVKAQVKGLPKTERDAIVLKVKENLANYSESISGQISTNYDFAPQSATTARVDHSIAMQNLAYDLAGFYYVAGNMSLDEAVKKATDNLINNKFDFITPGDADGVVRLPKSIVGSPTSYEQVLTSVLTDNTENKQIFDNLSFVTPVNDLGKYKSEVLSAGKFITKSDNSGVILVDRTSNPIIIQSEDEQANITQKVFELSFEQVASATEIYQSTSGTIRAKQIAVQNFLKDFY